MAKDKERRASVPQRSAHSDEGLRAKANWALRRDSGSIFCAIQLADSGSFTKASELLGMSPAALSLGIKKLEQAIGVRLFNRTTRQLTPTPEGLRFLELARDAADILHKAFDMFGAAGGDAEKTLRVCMLNAFGKSYVMPTMGRFFRNHDVSVEFGFNDTMPDLIREGFDVGLCYGSPKLNRQISRKLCRPPIVLVASKEYLCERGTPARPQDLADHELIAARYTGGQITEFKLQHRDGGSVHRILPQSRVVIFDQFDGLLDAALHGLGIAPSPIFTVLPHLEAGRLRIVLPDYLFTTASDDIRVVYPAGRYVPWRVRAFVNHLLDERKAGNWDHLDEAWLQKYGDRG